MFWGDFHLYLAIQYFAGGVRGSPAAEGESPGQRPSHPAQSHGAEVYPAEVYRKLLGCSCPNLPNIFEVAERNGENLVLEEFVEGDTLDFLLREALFSPEETRKIVMQLCRALWILHDLGAVHRDVKPDNVILREDEAVLIDFDAARVYKAEQEADTQILGTTGFAAPEQYGMSQSDSRADIYSVGVLMNVMLTGEHPSRRLAPGHLDRVVEHCTRVNPAKRYKNVLRLMEAL